MGRTQLPLQWNSKTRRPTIPGYVDFCLERLVLAVGATLHRAFPMLWAYWSDVPADMNERFMDLLETTYEVDKFSLPLLKWLNDRARTMFNQRQTKLKAYYVIFVKRLKRNVCLFVNHMCKKGTMSICPLKWVGRILSQ